MLRNMFKKTDKKSDPQEVPVSSLEPEKEAAPSVPEGMWKKCNHCRKPVYSEDVRNNFYICPSCGNYFHVSAYRRLQMVTDAGSFEEWDQDVQSENPLNFPGYETKLSQVRERTRMKEAVLTGKASIGGHETAIGVCDARFFMSSMGHGMGEKITRLFERADKEKLPVVLFCCSGGARMQEGAISLMQMAKTSAACRRHHDAGLLYISVLTDPTTGGVTASFAMLGDIILAEPDARIGFAGPRVIEQTIGEKLPEGFQLAEFQQDHGFVDAVVRREEMKDTLATILKLHKKPEPSDFDPIPELPEKKKFQVGKIVKSAWDSVMLSRKADRPPASEYISLLFQNFIEFHGDRYFGDDGAIIGGIAEFKGYPVTVIAEEKGKTTKENLVRNFGMPSPEGYRKALRLMKQAETFGRPVICFVDTPGAFCGMEAEERGQGEAIARNLFELAGLKVPVLSIVIGEGGSGGALALAVANEVYMLENAVYSVLSPEGFASILWKDSKRAKEAASVMKMTAQELKELGVIEQVIPEEIPASKNSLPEICSLMTESIEEFLIKYGALDGDTLSYLRRERFRRF